MDAVFERIVAHGVDAHHAVGQIDGGPRGHEEDADIADGGIDIVDGFTLGTGLRGCEKNDKRELQDPIAGETLPGTVGMRRAEDGH